MTIAARHVVIVSAIYNPEPVVSARMSQDLARHLAGRGNRVTVLCPPASRPLGVEYGTDTLAKARPCGKDINPQVITLPSRVSPRSRLWARMRESWSFGRFSARYIRTMQSTPDAVYANTWPLLGQLLLARACNARGIPLILHVQDIYPESAGLRLPLRRLLQWPLLALDRKIGRLAERVVLISAQAERYYAATRGLPLTKLTTIRNWVDDGMFATMPSREGASKHYGVPAGSRTFMFLGNIGPLAGVELLITAFARAQLPTAQLVIAGNGDRKEACEALVRQIGVPCVHFISEPRAERTPDLLALADVCLLPLRRGASLGSVPSKLMAYFLAGKPVLAAVDSESDTARCLAEAEAGWSGEPEDTEWLASSMRRLAALPESELAAVGAAGRSYGLSNFSKAAGVGKLAGIIADCVPSRPEATLPRNQLRVIPLSARHLSSASDLHLRAFPGFFLSRLGCRFVTELYRSYAAGPAAQGLVAVDGTGKMLGVLLGTHEPRRFYRSLLLRRGWVFALASLPALARDPGIAWRLLRALRYRGGDSDRPSGALLSSIAVEPSAQGIGVGRKLVAAWLEQLRRVGANRAYLTTDANGNEVVNQFYCRLGWSLESTYITPEGRHMNLYALNW